MNFTPEALAQRLRTMVETELDELDTIEDEAAEEAPESPGAWSKKHELGHLIDSATNNHVRFVLASLSKGEFHGPSYAQNDWVEVHGYTELTWDDLVTFWCSYNLLLEHMIERMPAEKLHTQCIIGSAAPVSLGWLIDDYMTHMQHHLDHILSREAITAYPPV